MTAPADTAAATALSAALAGDTTASARGVRGAAGRATRSPAVSLAALLSLCAGCGPTLGTPPTTCSTQPVSVGESPLMEPGGNCVDCHSSNHGPGFTFAGTVMNALDDDQNCQGLEGVQVRIIDAAGKSLEMLTNASGNFFSTAAMSTLTFPYKAEVTRNGITTRMATARSSAETNCAGCHTATGAFAAPGRIVAPGA